MDTPYHATVQKIKTLLDAQGVSYKTFEHEAVRTSEEAQLVRPEYSLAQGAKALIVRVKKKGLPKGEDKAFVQLVVPGDAKFDSAKAKAVLQAKDLRFATPEEVAELTNGIVPGGVPPFGNLFGLSVYVDQKVIEQTEIIFNAGDRRYSIALSTKDYLKVVEPEVVAVV